MKTALEIQLEAEVASLQSQLVAIDDRLGRDNESLLRRYEIALQEIAAFNPTGRETDMAQWLRAQIHIASTALVTTVLPRKRCGAPACTLSRGHGGQHYDGIRLWGRTRPARKPLEVAE